MHANDSELLNSTDIVPSQKIFFSVLLALESFFGSAANFVIILVISSTSFLRTVENAFVVNLAIADFLISFVTQPSSLAGILVGKQWFMDHPLLCAVIGQLCLCSCMATNWNTLLIAINRYILICQHQLYRRIYTRLNVSLMCLGAWICMFLISLPHHVGWGKLGFSDTIFVCTFDTTIYSYTMFVMGASLFFPATLTFTAYYMIYRTVRSSRHRVLAGQVVPAPRGNALRKNIATAKSLFKAYVVYLVLVMPFGIVMALGMGEKLPHIWYMLTLLLYHGVGTGNCFAYAARLGKFWDGFRVFFGISSKDNLITPSAQLSTTSQRVQKGHTSGPDQADHRAG